MGITCGIARSARNRRRVVGILVFSSALVGLLWPGLPSLAQARVSALEAGSRLAPVATLPPRVTAVPQPVTQSPAVPATAIHLAVQDNDPTLSIADLWAQVEWQDSAGVWHAVEGWQGALVDISGNVGSATWYLGADELGAGPFRWGLYAGRGGALLSSSAPFALPATEGSTVTVEMQMSPQPLLPQSGGISIAALVAAMAIAAGAIVTRLVSLRSDPRREV